MQRIASLRTAIPSSRAKNRDILLMCLGSGSFGICLSPTTVLYRNASSSLNHASSSTAQMSPIRLGFVGLSTGGWAARTLAQPLFEEPLSSQYTITAVSTTNPTSANASAENYGKLVNGTVKAYHGSTEHIANDPDVDMVAVSVRASAHVDAALPALQAKKDLFIEWPAGNQLAGTTQIAEAAKKAGVRTLVGLQTRQAAYIRKVKEILDSGILGRILSSSLIVSFCYPGARGPTSWEWFKYTSDPSNGATMLDVDGGHLIDLLHYLFGPISSITAQLANQYPMLQPTDNISGEPIGEPEPSNDVHQITFGGQFANKDATVLSVNIRNVLSEHGAGLFWVIDGEKGAIKMRADGISKGQSIMRAQPEVWLNGEKVDVVTDTETERCAKNWERYAEGVEGEYATLEDALQAKKVVDTIFKSSKEGRRIDL